MSVKARIEDILTGCFPAFATITLSEIHQLAGIAGALIGAAYVIWKWRMDAKIVKKFGKFED